MRDVVIWGVGSPVIVDVEASLERRGLHVIAAVRNVDGDVHLLDKSVLIDAGKVSREWTHYPFVVPLFSPSNRQRAARQALEAGFRSAISLIDPTAIVPSALEYAPGLYVNAGCTLGAASRFGEFVFINRAATVGHHALLDAFVSIGPGAVLAGNVKIGKGAVIGAGAVVLPNISVGANAVVGAGSVITRDVPGNCLVFGNPARVVRRDIPGYAEQGVI